MENQTYCNGKFILKEVKDSEDLKNDRDLDREMREKNPRKTTKKDRETERKYLNLNRKIRNSVFKYLKSLGYDVYDVNVDDGYFIFDMGRETVVSFKVRGRWLEKYLFGMWINPSNYFRKTPPNMTEDERKEYNALSSDEKVGQYRVVQIFQQHEDYIDKFKPSCSSPVISLNVNDVNEIFRRSRFNKLPNKYKNQYNDGYGYGISELKTLIKFMQHHPFHHFNRILENSDMLHYVDTMNFQFPMLCYLKERICYKYEETTKSIRNWLGKRKAIRICKGLASEKCVKSVTMTNFGNVVMEGCRTDYDYEIRIAFTKESTIEECSEAFDRHVDSIDIGQYDDYHHVAKIVVYEQGITKDADYTDENGKVHNTLYCINWEGRKDEINKYYKYLEWYNNGIKIYGNKEDIKKFKKKYPTFADYTMEFDYDCNSKCFIRSVGYDNDKNYEIICKQIAPKRIYEM